MIPDVSSALMVRAQKHNGIQRGIERETLRVTPQAQLQRPCIQKGWEKL